MRALVHGRAGFVGLLRRACAHPVVDQLWTYRRKLKAQRILATGGDCPYESNCETLSESCAPFSLLPPPSSSAP